MFQFIRTGRFQKQGNRLVQILAGLVNRITLAGGVEFRAQHEPGAADLPN